MEVERGRILYNSTQPIYRRWTLVRSSMVIWLEKGVKKGKNDKNDRV